MEGVPTQKRHNIPDAEMVDMAFSPVTQEEMDAAMKALDLDEGPAQIPEAEKMSDAEMVNSPVSEKEMQEAVDAINLRESPPIGDVFEKVPLKEGDITLGQSENTSGIVEVSDKLSDEERIDALRKELQAIPPDAEQLHGRPEENPGEGEWTQVKYKKCERCQGTGKWFLFVRCPVCKGKGQFPKTMVFPDGRTMNMSND